MPKTARRRATRKEKVQDGQAPTPRYQKPEIPLVAKTDKQALYIKSLQQSDVVLATGCAGTGKTYVAMTYAAQLYDRRQISKIVLTRPNIAAGSKSLGFFPGELEEKMAPWVKPAIEILEQHLGKQKVQAMIKCEEILIEPFETMRGRSFQDAFVVLDEAQNASVTEMKMFLTRLGEGCKTVVDGDVEQSDLPKGSGLRTVVNMVKRQMLPFPVVEFDIHDIVRSDVCAMWIGAFYAEGL